MGNLVLIKHARSLADEGRFFGHKDIRLSSKGTEEAEALKLEAKKLKRDKIYVSEYKRAIETAKILFEGEELKITNKANEIEFGKFIGYTHEDLSKTFKDEYELWSRDPFQFAPPGGEKLIDYYHKIAEFMEDLRRDSGNIVIVTHDSFIRAFIAILFLSQDGYFFTDIKNSTFQFIKNPDGFFVLSGLNKLTVPDEFQR